MMIKLFDNLDFLEFILCKLENEIKYQKELIENEKRNFFDKQLDFELCKELHTLEKWRDEVKEYIINLKSSRNLEKKIKRENNKVLDYSEQVAKLLRSNKELVDRNKELTEEIKLLNEEINQKLAQREYYYRWDEGD